MNDYLISLFIDNELNLDEKIDLVELVHDDASFKDETIGLLQQEKLLRGDMVTKLPAMPAISEPWRKSRLFSTWRLFFAWRPMVAGLSLATAVAAFFLFSSGPRLPEESQQRFVIYRPNTENMAILGSFTEWNPLPMEKIGSSGYWSITLKLKPGEYHYSYMMEDGLHIADPTVPTRENDDFGGENSIITIGASI
jgi:hypothetical protein